MKNSDNKVRNTSVYSFLHTENHFYISFVILLLKQLKYVKGTKYLAIDYLAV